MTNRIVRSSGNVFADMELPDAAKLDTKARLGAAINLAIEQKQLTQVEVAMRLGINQPNVSALLRYRLEGFSIDQLIHFLITLGQDGDYDQG